MPENWARLVYAIQFLIAVVAVFTLWSQVGGQVHLDMIPWYWKFGLGIGLSWTVVRATASAVQNEKSWNRKTVLWMLLAAACAVCMAVLVYYYHMMEPLEEEEMLEEETVAVAPPHDLARPRVLPFA